MISYLRRGETVIFSRESLLKQEEALAELDVSIDEFILKLEQAENRRLRLRQKLLEHVAAAIVLNPNAAREDIIHLEAPQRSQAAPWHGPIDRPQSPLRFTPMATFSTYSPTSKKRLAKCASKPARIPPLLLDTILPLSPYVASH
jgi:hypothetical protein